jgi:hypothetical protein
MRRGKVAMYISLQVIRDNIRGGSSDISSAFTPHTSSLFFAAKSLKINLCSVSVELLNFPSKKVADEY